MKLYVWSYLLVPLCASICGCPEDDYVEPINYEVEQPDLFYVDQDEKVFSEGEVIMINGQVPNIVADVDGKQQDIHRVTSSKNSILNMKLEKKSEFENPLLVRFSENELIIDEGMVKPYEYDNSNLEVELLYDGDSYNVRFGIVLKEKGEYYLSQYHEEQNGIALWFVDEDYDKDAQEYINIRTSFKEGSDDGYRFVVE